MNPRTINSICVVTAPDLRGIIQHSGIKSSTASAAAFNKNIRITVCKFFQEIVHPKNIIIGHIWCINICQTTVHIPFNVLHIPLIQNCANTFKYLIAYFFSGKIKNQLVSGTNRLAAWNCDCPVRMFPVKITVLTDHFRLNPDTEFHAFCVYSFD